MNAAQDSTTAPAGDDPRLLRAAQEYLAELEAGRHPDRAAFVARLPELASTLEPYLDALDMFHAASPAPPSALPTPHGAMSAEPLGDFRIVREIGHGGMGTVYEAVQLSLARRVALKVLPFAAALDAKQLQRFKNEAQAAAQLHHTNIVPVYGVGCERGVHYYAMQLIEGQNFAEVIRELRPPEAAAPPNEPPTAQDTASITASPVAAELSTQRASRSGDYYRSVARLTVQAADALEHAHQLGVIHRDVKPANLMVDALGTVWITDFGLAQFHARAGLTRTGDLLGTLRYMSPEQAAGQGVALDPRTDVYSLGATLYELLTLEPLFDGDDHARLLNQILNNEPRPPRTVDPLLPPELDTIVLKAVSKNPADRYGSARELADDLRRFVDHRPILARRPTLPQRVRKWTRRHPSVVAAGIVLLLLVAAGSLVSAGLIRAAYERERERAEEAEVQFRLAQKAVNEMIEISNEELADNPHLEGVRKRVLMSALVYYQEFIDRRKGNPAAQEELRDTKAHVERILADLALLQGAGLVHLLGQPAVLDDLQLSDEQRATVSELATRLRDEDMELFRKFGQLSPEARQQRFLDRARAHDAALAAVLTASNVQRLRQIALQLQALAAFRSPDIAAELKLTADQRKRIRAIESETFFVLMDAKFSLSPDGKFIGSPSGKFSSAQFEELRKTHKQKQKAAMERVLAVLSDEQKRTWREMTGARFEGTLSFPPMRFPPRFGPGKGPGGQGKGPGGPPEPF